jgi:hypothetical protein
VRTDQLSDADELALTRLIIELMWRIDHQKGDSVHELYTEDAECSEGPPLNMKWKGRDAIIEWGGRRPLWIKHVMTNFRWVAAGPDHAEGSNTITAYLDLDTDTLGTTIPRMVGENTWRCVRTPEGWRIAMAHCDFYFVRSETPYLAGEN